MNLSHIHRKRAADRKISIKNGHFVYQDTHERVGFLGSNLVGRACFPSKTAADNLAEQLWKMGYNSVRLHHYDGYLVDYPKSHNILNKKLIDKMDYLIRGIYVFIDLFSIRRLARNVTEKLGLKRHPSNDQYKNMMALFPEVFDDWKDFASLILNHVNPYTGFAWKDDLGSNALLTDLNHRAYLPLPFSRRLFDFIDIHCYWDHPSYPVHKFTFPQLYKNNSSLKHFAEWPLNVAPARQFGKSFTVSEYNYSASNIYRSEMGLLIGAYASLQDWDALYSFQFAETSEQITSPEKITKFNICSDPVRLLGERIIALLFIRGDVAPAKKRDRFSGIKRMPGVIL